MNDILNRKNKPDIAYNWYEGSSEAPALPPLVFLGGFRSDMEGTKALFLEEKCKERQQPFLRFDYRGHGKSGGVFERSVISDWLTDVEDVITHCIAGKALLVGSSMGGWLSLLYARKNVSKVSGIIGLAAAPDFTSWMRDGMQSHHKQQMESAGEFLLENDYSDPYIITRALLDDGDKNLLLNDNIGITCPVTLIQGKKDTDVPWETAEKILSKLRGTDNKATYIERGDHRLSAPEELEILDMEVTEMLAKL